MGRLVYQPISEENSNDSKHGQLIGNIYTGHLSTNHNNIINSATKRIENKLNDVLQLENNLIEQTNVISNLIEDYKYFLNNNLPSIYTKSYETLSKAVLANEDVDYITRGVSDKEDVNGTNTSVLKLLETACIDSLKEAKQTNEIHSFMINHFSTQLTISRDSKSNRVLGNLDSLEALLGIETSTLQQGDSYIINNILYVWNKYGGEDQSGAWETVPTDLSINSLISTCTDAIEEQSTKAQLLRTRLINMLG